MSSEAADAAEELPNGDMELITCVYGFKAAAAAVAIFRITRLLNSLVTRN